MALRQPVDVLETMLMPANTRDIDLLERLQAHEILRQRGYSFVLGPKGGVVVDRRGHVRGIWHHDGERYAWAPSSNTHATYWADDADAAVRYTLIVISV